jgi:type IV secretory pathway TraG/TraD family ATPase VirD4
LSAPSADNLLSLLARGRESGVGVLLATQELADLERAGRGFRDQVLGITAVTLAHRQEVHESALAISRMAGTRRVWRETQTIPSYPALSDAPASRGSRRQQEEPVVHPNTIKRLSTGRVVLLSGVPRPTVAEGRVDARTPGVRPRPPGIRSRVPGIRSRPAGIRSRVPGIRSRARTGDGRGR